MASDRPVPGDDIILEKPAGEAPGASWAGVRLCRAILFVQSHLAEDTGAAHHGPAAVLELGLSEPPEELGVLAEAEGVEPEVTCERYVSNEASEQPPGARILPYRPGESSSRSGFCFGRKLPSAGDPSAMRRDRGVPLSDKYTTSPS